MAAAILSSLCVPADLRSRLGAGGRWQLDLDRGQFFQAAEVGLDLRIHLFAGHRRGALRYVQAFVRVNPDLLDGRGLDAGEVLGVLEQEPGPPEGVIHLRAAKLVQVHAQGEVLDVDALEHGRNPGLENTP